MSVPAFTLLPPLCYALLYCSFVGDGATGAVETIASKDNSTASLGTYLYAGTGAFGSNGGLGCVLFGSATPLDNWVSGYSTGPTTPVAAGATAPTQSLSIFPNDFSFPPSEVPASLAPGVDVADLRSILTAVHGAVVAALHSYDFAPEVRGPWFF
jgi:hypothetical protein